MLSRREFLRNTSLAVVGGIFVPKFERWFQPLASRSLRFGPGEIQLRQGLTVLCDGLDYDIVDGNRGIIHLRNPRLPQEPILVDYDPRGTYGERRVVLNEVLTSHPRPALYALSRRSVGPDAKFISYFSRKENV